ncbi:TM2 domain-containing membrane protein YozV [Saccharothrix tamanrassetensis]|uniref:TM2 domain-containing membrane protein YozV n=1 Tax=Saccharothrix tamanrassetensis TaxID=1051531 RepID=A0A841CDK3_9PSEU|nr:hypothetical protein [Saccharothrix tamanrassetensis]MBB5955070.1 TM2 domain-containing membrane protein YozV [Saccharothrix tamanrassetensis]
MCGTVQWPQQPPVFIPHAPPATGPQPVQYATGPQPVQYGGYGAPMPIRGVVTAKSPGIAVLLSFLWLGAGNLYAGQTALGIILIIVNFPLAILAMTVLGLIIAFPVWLILAVLGMVMAAQGAKDFNHRNGIMVR